MPMKCPACGHLDTKVLDTRMNREGDSIRRRRECLACGSRFNTQEVSILDFPLVIKKDGRREEFSKDKIRKGLKAATQKRPVAQTQIEEVVERVSKWVLNRAEREIPSMWIGRKVIMELRLLDDVAYVRFASVYQSFRDIDEFVSQLESQAPTTELE